MNSWVRKLTIAETNRQLDSCKCTRRSEQFEYMSKFCWSKNWSLFWPIASRFQLRHATLFRLRRVLFHSELYVRLHSCDMWVCVCAHIADIELFRLRWIGKHTFPIYVFKCAHVTPFGSGLNYIILLKIVSVAIVGCVCALAFFSLFCVLTFGFQTTKCIATSSTQFHSNLDNFIIVSHGVVNGKAFGFLSVLELVLFETSNNNKTATEQTVLRTNDAMHNSL